MTDLYSQIHSKLDTFRESIRTSGWVGNTDKMKSCENLFRDIFNAMYDLKLINLNTEQNNYPDIDLGDSDSGICYQITCNKSVAAKVKATLNGYLSDTAVNAGYLKKQKYTTLRIFFIIADKPSKNISTTDADIIFMEDFYRSVQDLHVDKQVVVLNILEKSLLTKTREEKLTKHMIAIKKVIDFIASNDLDIPESANNISNPPNPARKLQEYFEYGEVIKQEYLTLSETYSILIHEIKKQISSSEHTLVKNWLTSNSLRLLQKHSCQGRPALDELEKNIFNKIDTDDDIAVRFFVLHELIHCDIFPLPTV